jgi:predicted transcriptional regulator
MKEIKIKWHSVVDLITNSSTVLYTYSGGVDKILEELFNEQRKVFNIKETLTDIFHISILCEEHEYYDYLTERLDILDYTEDEFRAKFELPEDIIVSFKEYDHKSISSYIKSTIEAVKHNKIAKPKWMEEIEKHEDYDSYLTPSTYIYLIAKDEKYEAMAKMFDDLIYGTNHDAARNG